MTADAGRAAAPPDQATILAFIGVVIVGGLNAIAVKQSVQELDPFWSAGLRFVVAALLLFGLVIVMRRSFPRGRSLSGALLYGLVAFAGSFGLVYPALRDLPAGTAILFLALVPLETFGLAVLHRQERFQLQGLFGAFIALGGVGLVVADQLSANVPLASILMMLAGTLFVAEGAVILKWVPRSDPFATNAVAMTGGGLALLALSLVAGEAWLVPTRGDTWVAMGYLVVFGSIVLFGLYLFALRRWTASAVSYVTLLMPLITIPVAAILIAETVSLSFLVGGALALLGVYVGAFLQGRPRRTSASGLAECPPLENCGPAATTLGAEARRAG
ncbi:MAG TPA: EamA family transporter [Candidatus Limnocylindria bacterium]